MLTKLSKRLLLRKQCLLSRSGSLIMLLSLTYAMPVNSERCPCNNEATIFGIIETARFISMENLEVEALIDTGATTTAMDARNIQMHINRDGKRWVYYNFFHKPTGKQLAMYQPVSRVARILTHQGPPVERAVVLKTIAIGNTQRSVEVSLINRSNFSQQLLIGRNYLNGTALVDSNKKHLGRGEQP